MNPETIKALGNAGAGFAAVIGLIWLGDKFLNNLIPILDAQTKALEAIARAYAGYITAK